LPQFNAEVDRSFADAGARLDRQLFAGLRATDLFPSQYRYESTDSSLRMSSKLIGPDETAGNVPDSRLLPESSGATLLLHESAINNAIHRMGLDGRTMTEDELRSHLEAFLSKALSRPFKFSAPSKPAGQPTPVTQPRSTADEDDDEDGDDQTPAKLVFAERDAIRVQIRSGQVFLIIRTGLEREGKDPIPTQEVTVPLNIAVQGDRIVITRDNLEIVGIEEDLSPIQRKVMNSKIGNALPTRTANARFTLKGTRRSVEARVQRLQFADGWASIGVQ
jgi:hypothetical protein